MDWRPDTRDGQPAVEWTWEGNDGADMAEMTGRGWAKLEDDDLHGMIVIHLGDESDSFEISPKLVTGGEVARPLPHVLIYFSFVTLTTVGYGDISPVSPATRTLAWMEAIAGQFYLAVIVAGLVSLLVSKGKREGVP